MKKPEKIIYDNYCLVITDLQGVVYVHNIKSDLLLSRRKRRGKRRVK